MIEIILDDGRTFFVSKESSTYIDKKTKTFGISGFNFPINLANIIKFKQIGKDKEEGEFIDYFAGKTNPQ